MSTWKQTLYKGNPNVKVTQDDIDFTMEEGKILTGRQPILQLPNLNKKLRKPVILFLVIVHYTTSRQHDLAFITEDFKIYTFRLGFQFRTRHITERIRFKFSKIFSQFTISDKTNIVLLNNITPYSPIRIYLKIVQQYTKCKMVDVTMEQAISRIYSYCKFRYQKSKKTNKYQDVTKENISSRCYSAWYHLIESGTCPWITGVVEQQLTLLTKDKAMCQRRVRLVLYYAYIRAARYRDNKRCEARKQERIQLQQQQQEENNSSINVNSMLS